MKRLLFLFLFLPFLAFRPASDDKADDIVGTWLVGTKTAHVKIFKTGNYYYGKLVWMKNPNDEKGNPRRDIRNPEESERNRTLLNLLLLKGFEYDEDHHWDNGTIYDPKSGKTYDCKIWFENGDTDVLKLRGFLGVSMLGRTDTWTRVRD